MTTAHADGPVVVVGGGVVGMSIAFHLTQLEHRDVIVVERGELGEGSTAAATGGVRQQFTSRINAALVHRSVEFFATFTERTGEPLDFRQHGYLFLLTDEQQQTVFSRAVRMQNELGIPSQTLTPDEVHKRFAGTRTDDLIGATYCPTDGSASPQDAVNGFAKAARRGGAQILRHTNVTGFTRDGDGAVTGVTTSAGALKAAAVVIAAGPQAREVGRLAGVDLPVSPHRRQAFALGGTSWVQTGAPLAVDVASGAYVHPEGSGGAVVGGNDRVTPEGTDTAVDWSLLEPLMGALIHRWPGMADAQLMRGWAGLREMTPDDHALVGPVPAMPGLWAAVGFSGHGFMQAPAIGEALAQLLVHESADIDLHPLRLSRFAEHDPVAEGVLF